MRHICLLLTVLFIAGVTPLAGSAQSVPRCFDNPTITNCIDGRFREYWEANGGLSVFGYPTTPARMQQSADGTFLTQYFERNRFELHQDNQAPYDVLLGRLGDDRLRQQGRDWQSFSKANPSDAHYFAESGHAIAHDPFWSYWSSHGLEFDGQPGVSQGRHSRSLACRCRSRRWKRMQPVIRC